MGLRGPKPKPLALRKLEGGNRVRVSLPASEAVEIASDLPPVKPIAVQDDPVANAEWDRVISAVPPSMYTALDTATLALYSLTWSIFLTAQADISRNGITVIVERENKDGELTFSEAKPNPAVSVWKSASETLLKCADRLGLAPGARAKLQIPSRDAKPPSRFDGLLAQRPADQTG